MAGAINGGGGQSRRIRLVPHLENARSLHFEAITRDVRPGDVPLRIGRFTDRNAGAAVTHSNNKLAFRSKVVSRGHAEIWLEGDKVCLQPCLPHSNTDLLLPPSSRAFALTVLHKRYQIFFGHIPQPHSPRTAQRRVASFPAQGPGIGLSPCAGLTLLQDGDILQLGVDYQGGTEEIYRCVKMRVEVGREWQNAANAFK